MPSSMACLQRTGEIWHGQTAAFGEQSPADERPHGYLHWKVLHGVCPSLLTSAPPDHLEVGAEKMFLQIRPR